MKRIAILILLALFLAGCANTDDKDTTTGKAFIGGTEGITLAFVGTEPPAEVLDDGQQTFFITMLLTNNGEYTIPAGKIIASLSGISKEAFNLATLNIKSNFDLERARKERDQTTPGAIEELNFGEAKYKPDLPADFFTEIRADVCYDYETSAISSLCLKKNLLQKNDEDNCAVDNAQSKFENSGGPIQITSIRQRPVSGNKLSVTFDIMNQGPGKVYKPGTFIDVCTSNDINENVVVVELSSPTSKFPINCRRFIDASTGEVRLVNGIKTVTCEIDTSGLQEATFADILLIKARYVYRQAISTPVTIRNAAF